jgi:phage tail protein X
LCSIDEEQGACLLAESRANNLSLWSSSAVAMTCRANYKHLNGTVEAVLAAKRLLVDAPQPLRAGLLIIFPEVVEEATERVQLWD